MCSSCLSSPLQRIESSGDESLVNGDGNSNNDESSNDRVRFKPCFSKRISSPINRCFVSIIKRNKNQLLAQIQIKLKEEKDLYEKKSGNFVHHCGHAGMSVYLSRVFREGAQVALMPSLFTSTRKVPMQVLGTSEVSETR